MLAARPTIRPALRRGRPSRERGIVVFVALIAVVLLSLAAVGLMRTVHTSTIVVGNLAFRQAAQAMAAAAVERAVFDMKLPTKTIADLTTHDVGHNYYASVQPGQSAMGIPAALQGDPGSNYPGAFQTIVDAETQNTARWVIERMCDDDALGKDAVNAQKDCEMIRPKQSPAKETNLKKGIALPRIPYYRMTVRVDGPPGTNSVAFSQAMLR
jgi:Tfp pilus assembly protein PilX